VILSKREKYIAIGVGIAVGLLVLDQYLLSPFLARDKAITAETDKVQQQLSRATKLMKEQRDLKPVWADMTSGGLKTTREEADSQALNAVREWAQDAGVSIVALGSSRYSEEQKFMVSTFHVTGTGRMQSISKLMWALETAPIPVRVNEIQITPQKEGTDNLQVQLTVSTLSALTAEPEKPDRRTSVSHVDFGGRW
jgi:type II secretory pathway component PulM